MEVPRVENSMIDDWVSQINMEFASEDEAYHFYVSYGGRLGFSIRRGPVHKSEKDANILTSRIFLCNKAGLCEEDDESENRKCFRPITRVNCGALMGIKLTVLGTYKCNKLVLEHNHELHNLSTRQFLKSQRNVSPLAAHEICLADESGIGAKATFEYLGRQAGGKEIVGFTEVDLYNHLQTKRQRELLYGEAAALLNYFEDKSRDNPSYYSSYQLDQEQCITNIFWADARMKNDYAIFGDVVEFDTTYCTNKESRPFGVFCGFNNHRKVVIFGATLLYDETAASFKWLFETFMKAHGGKKPITIFTDQDAAMAKALSQVFPGTKHGLCTWHIRTNLVKHMGNLLKDDSCLLQDFGRCMYGCEDIASFEHAWEKLCLDYSSDKSDWLDRIYMVKEKWAHCFMKNSLTLGIRSTQLSESLNADLKDYMKPTLNVMRFMAQFERVLNDKRYKELKVEFDSKDKLPRNNFERVAIMVQTSKKYTPKIFELFQKEYSMIGACSVIKISEKSNELQEFIVKMDDEPTEFVVLCHPIEKEISFSCRKFESFGFLCCHALKIFDLVQIKSLPSVYIINRWTRSVKDMAILSSDGVVAREDPNLDCTQRYRILCADMIKLMVQASETPEGYELARSQIADLRKELSVLSKVPSLNEPTKCLVDESISLKKKLVQNKGKKRLKPWPERTKNRTNQSDFKKKKSKCNSYVTFDFEGILQNFSKQASIPTPSSFSRVPGSQILKTPSGYFTSLMAGTLSPSHLSMEDSSFLSDFNKYQQ